MAERDNEKEFSVRGICGGGHQIEHGVEDPTSVY